jgi:hypothetical protein
VGRFYWHCSTIKCLNGSSPRVWGDYYILVD